MFSRYLRGLLESKYIIFRYICKIVLRNGKTPPSASLPPPLYTEEEFLLLPQIGSISTLPLFIEGVWQSREGV